MVVHVLDDYYLAITLLITIAYQLFFFSIAWTFKFDKVTGIEPSIHRIFEPTNFTCKVPSDFHNQTSQAVQISSSSPFSL